MNSKIIMVDFFDTVMFRKVHSSIFLKNGLKSLRKNTK